MLPWNLGVDEPIESKPEIQYVVWWANLLWNEKVGVL